MKRETIEKILNFLYEKEGKELPNKWFKSIGKLKLIEELENHLDDTQYKYYGDLDLSGSNILNILNMRIKNILPNDFYIQGTLWLTYGSKPTKLPDKLHVEGDLLIWDSNITELPNNFLYVGGDLYINNIPLAKKYTDEEIREIVTSTGGQINGKILRDF